MRRARKKSLLGLYEEKARLLVVVIALIILPLLGSLLFPAGSRLLDSRLADPLFKLRYALRGREGISPYIVHVVFDDASLALVSEGGSEREVYARLISAISAAGARAVACDVVFGDDAGVREGGEALAKAVEAAGEVYFPIVPLGAGGRSVKEAGTVPTAPGLLEKALWAGIRTSRASAQGQGAPLATGIIAPARGLVSASAGLGEVSCLADSDGVNRSFPLLYRFADAYLPSLPLRLACDYLSVGPGGIEVDFGHSILLKGARLPGGQARDIAIPIDRSGKVLIDYAAPWRSSFYTISAKDLLDAAEGNAELGLRLRDIMEKALVLVSDGSARNKDLGPGLLDPTIPFSEILLTVANGILGGTGLRYTPPMLLPPLLLVLAALLWLAGSRPRAVERIALAGGVIAAFFLWSACLFLLVRVEPPLALPLLGLALYALAESLRRAIGSERRETYFRRELARLGREARTAIVAEGGGRPSTADRQTEPEPRVDEETAGGEDAYRALRATLRRPEAFERIVTKDRAMIRIFRDIESYAHSKAPILIVGETGVGKELFAHAIHVSSGRSGSYVILNAAGINDELFNDTLFGHKRGAYTGAERDEQGFVEVAEGGTLFLDEIGDLSPASQVKLLRLIENMEYYPLNSKTLKKADVRIIGATNAELAGKVEAGSFRNDLARRLGLRIYVPPLRQRPGDLGPLLRHFIARSAASARKAPPSYSRDLLGLLASYAFPGNVRELESMVEEAVSKDETGTLPVSVFRERIAKEACRGEALVTDRSGSRRSFAYDGDLQRLLSEVEASFIAEALAATKGNKRKAAELLGVNYDWLKRKVRG